MFIIGQGVSTAQLAEMHKRKKWLIKRLREILRLKKLVALGHHLNDDQKVKLSKSDAFQSELDLLSIKIQDFKLLFKDQLAEEKKKDDETIAQHFFNFQHPLTRWSPAHIERLRDRYFGIIAEYPGACWIPFRGWPPSWRFEFPCELTDDEKQAIDLHWFAVWHHRNPDVVHMDRADYDKICAMYSDDVLNSVL